MGFEKIEPGVQRKDVDRRLAVLRREQIRNTGLRFKFNQITARYNTYATHWQRVIREIENGTYKRDVVRAAKRFGAEALTLAAKKRFKNLQVEEQAPAPRERSDVDLDVDFHDDDDELFAPPPPPSQSIAARGLPAPPSGRITGVVAESRPSVPPPSSRQPASDPAPGSLRPLAPARPASIPAGAELAPTPRPLPTIASPPAARAPSPSANFDDDDDELFAGLDLSQASKIPTLGERAPTLRGAAPRPPSPAPPQVAAQPRPAARTLDVTRSAEPMRSPPREEPAAPPVQVARPAPMARPAPVQAPQAPARPAPVAPPVARPAPVAAAALSPGTSLSDGRLREIYGQFVESKRKCQESTAAVTFDGLARNLRESAAKLAEKHAGKKIDFEVVVKDGKTVLKPVVR
ncbi:MAG: MXAN_5187 C-terminal domain-containing protein [Polyangiaceae bacterium]